MLGAARLDVGNWEMYVSAYKTAADMLSDHVIKDAVLGNSLIYPICFLYRQYLELRLKKLIISGRALLDDRTDPQHVHNLETLWRSCRAILEQVFPNESTDAQQVVEDCIREFSRVDPQSMGFRYPAAKDGQPTLGELKLSHVCIQNLKHVMERMSGFLEGATGAVIDYLDAKHSASQGW